MSTPKKFCSKCGTAHAPGAKFCASCGERFPPSQPTGMESLKKSAEVMEKVSSAVSKAESIASSAGTVARTAKDLSKITIRPPAEWKVVVGEVLPVAGKKVVDSVVSTAGQKVEQKVTEEVSRVVTEHLGASSQTPVPESFVPHQAPLTATSGVPCPSCGNPMIPGKKFCGSCGAKIGETAKPASAPPLQPVCPACGTPVIPGKKFCGSCGQKLA